MKYFLFRLFLKLNKLKLLIEIGLITLIVINAIMQISNIVIIAIMDTKDIMNTIQAEKVDKQEYTEEDLEIIIKKIIRFIKKSNILEVTKELPITQSILNNEQIIRNFVYEHAQDIVEIKKNGTTSYIKYYLDYIVKDLIISNPLFIEKQLYELLDLNIEDKKPFKINIILDLIKLDTIPLYMIDICATKQLLIKKFILENSAIIFKNHPNISLMGWEQNLLKAFNDYVNNTNIKYIYYQKYAQDLNSVLVKNFDITVIKNHSVYTDSDFYMSKNTLNTWFVSISNYLLFFAKNNATEFILTSALIYTVYASIPTFIMEPNALMILDIVDELFTEEGLRFYEENLSYTMLQHEINYSYRYLILLFFFIIDIMLFSKF